jgi:hypothetical protein
MQLLSIQVFREIELVGLQLTINILKEFANLKKKKNVPSKML